MNRKMIAVAAGAMTLAGASSASAQALVIEGPYAAPVYEVAPAPFYAAPVVVAPAPCRAARSLRRTDHPQRTDRA